MTLRLTGRKRPAHERQGSWQPLKRLKMREGHEVREQLSVVAAAASVAGAAVALQLSCYRQEVRTPAGPLGVVGGRACRAIVAMGGADLHEEETEEEEEGVGKEEQVSVPKRSKRLTITQAHPPQAKLQMAAQAPATSTRHQPHPHHHSSSKPSRSLVPLTAKSRAVASDTEAVGGSDIISKCVSTRA